MNRSELFPIMIIIAVLAIIYLVMRHLNRKAKSRLSRRKGSWKKRH